MIKRFLSPFVLFGLLVGVSPCGAAIAADLGTRGAPPAALVTKVDPEAAEARLAAHAERLAALQLLRAAFDVIPSEAVPEILGRQLERLGPDGPTARDLDALDLALHSEIAYYIVSLRYLIEAGGSLWPEGRPEHFYVNDALIELAAVLEALPEVIKARADPLALLQRINRIHAFTEGFSEVPPALDFFEERDDLVRSALEDHGPRTST